MIPTLNTVADLLCRSGAPNYIQTGRELRKWLDEDWPNALTRVGELVPAALAYQQIEGHLTSLVELQRQLDALKPNDLRSRVRLQTSMFAVVKALTRTLEEYVRNGCEV